MKYDFSYQSSEYEYLVMICISYDFTLLIAYYFLINFQSFQAEGVGIVYVKSSANYFLPFLVQCCFRYLTNFQKFGVQFGYKINSEILKVIGRECYTIFLPSYNKYSQIIIYHGEDSVWKIQLSNDLTDPDFFRVAINFM